MPSPDHESSHRLRRLLWVTGACMGAIALALLLAVGALRHLRQATELALMRRELQMAAIERRSLEIELESERLITREELAVALEQRDGARDLFDELVLTLLRPRAAGATEAAAVVWDPTQQRGVLLVSGLPAGAAGRAYQLWHDGSPIDGAQFVAKGKGEPVRVTFRAQLAIDDLLELRTAPSEGSATSSIILTNR